MVAILDKSTEILPQNRFTVHLLSQGSRGGGSLTGETQQIMRAIDFVFGGI
jgi:hypothetical protein